jgi:glycogen debranching enzyme
MQLVRDLRPAALAALDWIDRYGDLDGDGFVEYRRRSDHGLVNQSWKDSGDSQAFHDGRLADPPIAPAEVQGYVYDAKRRMSEIAAAVWRDRDLAARLEVEAEELRGRFASTPPTGAPSAAASTHSRSTPRSGGSTPCARTWATSSGAASSRPSASTRSSTS